MTDLSFYLPAPTPDLGGAASLLAELGGMVIFHDAAGCMENYAVYDEPRWFGSDSLIFSSSLLQLDAVLGNDAPLLDAAAEAAERLRPAFLALIGTPVPAVTGMDLAGMAAELEHRTGLPAFGVDCTGFRPYSFGAGQALARLAERFAQPRPREPGRLNLLGVTPLDFSPPQLAALQARLGQAGWRSTALCMGAGLEDVRALARAERNLVVSEAGLPAARLLQRRFGTPYTCLTPLTAEQAQTLQDAPAAAPDAPRALAVGEPVLARSLAQALNRRDLPTLAAADWTDEETLTRLLAQPWALVAGDPLLQPLCKRTERFFPWSHTALSSHLYAPAAPETLDALLGEESERSALWAADETQI